jgi:hypothetical protein
VRRPDFSFPPLTLVPNTRFQSIGPQVELDGRSADDLAQPPELSIDVIYIRARTDVSLHTPLETPTPFLSLLPHNTGLPPNLIVIQMDQESLAALVQLAQLTCVLLISTPCRTLSSVTLSRLADKVILPVSNSSGERSKLTVYPAI